MKPWRAIARAAMLETMSDPLSILLASGSIAAVALSCVFHIHQFGEPARMARDAGLSIFLVSVCASGVFCTIKAFRREIESGTMQMALARPVSRRCFFLSKTAGCFCGCAATAAALAATACTAVLGMEAGGAVASPSGDIARIWKPALLAIAVSAVLPMAAAAALNRFKRIRFARTAMLLTPCACAAGTAACAALLPAAGLDARIALSALKTIPAALMLLFHAAVMTSAAAAFSMRFKGNIAATLCGVLFLVSLPAAGNRYAAGALAGGGSVPWKFFLAAAAVSIPFIAAFAAIGVRFARSGDADRRQ